QHPPSPESGGVEGCNSGQQRNLTPNVFSKGACEETVNNQFSDFTTTGAVINNQRDSTLQPLTNRESIVKHLLKKDFDLRWAFEIPKLRPKFLFPALLWKLFNRGMIKLKSHAIPRRDRVAPFAIWRPGNEIFALLS
ncbi:hypothetical protein PIB30_089874, partial [Stylosanthes scabra]|nr:hypothetical protein [Stylosanthes scabra]